jgi:hypothetical protein
MANSSKFAQLIRRQKESGLSIRSFCSNEGIAPSTFYYWQKKLRHAAIGKQFIPLVVKPTVATFNGVNQKEPVQRTGDDILFEIMYPNGITLRIKNDLDLSGLRALISLLD